MKTLRDLYSRAAAYPGIAGLVIATRPDCIDEQILDLLLDLQKKTFIRLEIGVESWNDQVLLSINRCHDAKTAIAAIKTTSCLLPVCIHLIVGLPGEQENYLEDSARIVTESGADMVKLHHLQIVKGSHLADVFSQNPLAIKLHTLETYIRDLGIFLSHLAPSIAIDRFINRIKPDQLLAPRFNIRNEAEFQVLLENYLVANDLFQGKFFQQRLPDF